jgi:glycosyltransferase involved in cell wall biosynthesis
MFANDMNYEIIPIFLAYQDSDRIDQILGKYKNLRIIYKKKDIKNVFEDIDICVNNLWISLDTIKEIKNIYPDKHLISVCHSLIKMEHITNLGSIYTNNFYDQEITFMNSDVVVLISNAEEKYYKQFGYDKYDAVTYVIYNCYKPKYDDSELDIDYSNDNIGYIGRHVPRKRPELPILSVNKIGRKDIQVYNMGVDYKNGSNDYWTQLEKIFEEQLTIIPFTSNKKIKEEYWESIGVNCITGIYEPYGYTICEALDRRIPVIVQDIDGPSEIIKGFEKNVYMYNVDQKSLINDVNNFTKALEVFWNTNEETRKHNAEVAREALKQFKPTVIGDEWKSLIDKCLSGEIPIAENNENVKEQKSFTEIISYKIKDGMNYAIENLMSNLYIV